MTKKEMIAELCKSMPPYANNFTEFIPGKTQVLYSGPYFDHRELEMAMEALLTGKWLTSGEYVARFQNMFAKRFNVRYAHMVNSGSSANLVMIASLKKHLGWKDGDEIIVSPVGFPTTIAPIVQNNLVPVFVDIEMDTLNFDVSQIEHKVKYNTRAIFVSPVLGNPPDMDVLSSICAGNDLALIGDNCDSLGSAWDGKLLNELYYSWTTSFYAAHHITTGEGGMVCSDDPELFNLVRSLSWWGRDCRCVGAANLIPCGTCGTRFSKWLPDVDEVLDHRYIFQNMGYRLAPLEISGAIGLAQLEKFTDIEKKRKHNKDVIAGFFKHIDRVKVASQHPQASVSWFGVPLVCDNAETRRSLVGYLEKNLIQTRPYFAGNLLRHPGYNHLDNALGFPNAERVLHEVFFLGCAPHYTPEILEYIGKVIGAWQG